MLAHSEEAAEEIRDTLRDAKVRVKADDELEEIVDTCRKELGEEASGWDLLGCIAKHAGADEEGTYEGEEEEEHTSPQTSSAGPIIILPQLSGGKETMKAMALSLKQTADKLEAMARAKNESDEE